MLIVHEDLEGELLNQLHLNFQDYIHMDHVCYQLHFLKEEQLVGHEMIT